MPDSEVTKADPPETDPSQTARPKTARKTDAPRTTRKRRRGTDGPKPMTVFTGSHGLQADQPRAGDDTNPDDGADPVSDPDLRR